MAALNPMATSDPWKTHVFAIRRNCVATTYRDAVNGYLLSANHLGKYGFLLGCQSCKSIDGNCAFSKLGCTVEIQPAGVIDGLDYQNTIEALH